MCPSFQEFSTDRVIDAPHKDAKDWFVGSEELHLLVFDAKVLLLDHIAAKKH